MGISMFVSVVAVDPSRPPDWAAARAAIDGIGLDAVRAFYVYGGFGDGPDETAQIDEMIEEEGFAEVATRVRQSLAGSLDLLESEFSAEWSRQAVTFEHGGLLYLVTGGPSAGSYPTDLLPAIGELAVTGVLEVAGVNPVCVDLGNMEVIEP